MKHKLKHIKTHIQKQVQKKHIQKKLLIAIGIFFVGTGILLVLAQTSLARFGTTKNEVFMPPTPTIQASPMPEPTASPSSTPTPTKKPVAQPTRTPQTPRPTIDYSKYLPTNYVKPTAAPQKNCPQPDSSLKNTIEQKNTQLKQMDAELTGMQQELQGMSPQDPSYQQKVDAYNTKVSQRNSLAVDITNLQNQYNKQVDEYNTCIK